MALKIVNKNERFNEPWTFFVHDSTVFQYNNLKNIFLASQTGNKTNTENSKKHNSKDKE